MAKILPLLQEIDSAADILEWWDRYSIKGYPNAHARAVNLLRHAAERERNKGKPKQPKRKTVTGYVGSRHVKVKVQGLFDEANKDEG